MFDFENVPSVEDLYEMDFLANPEPATQDTIVIQSQDTQAKGLIFEANLNQIQEPIRLQGNQGQPITIEMAKTLQELGVNEVLAENVPFSPVDSGNGTHDSDSEDDTMDESSDDSEEEKKKKIVKTGKKSGKKLKMWQIKTPFTDKLKEAKRQRAIQARKNRERSKQNKQSLQVKFDNLQKSFNKLQKKYNKEKQEKMMLQTEVKTYKSLLKITKK